MQNFTEQNLKHLITSFFEEVPVVDLRYIRKLSSPTGIYQHARYQLPNYHHGYCLDDNSRAMLLLLMADPKRQEETLFRSYLSFIAYAQLADGNFRNFMSYDLQWLEPKGSEDSLGRTIWALGCLMNNGAYASYFAMADELFNRSLPPMLTLRSARAIAYTLLGLEQALAVKPKDDRYLENAKQLSLFLVGEFRSCADADWPWFEEVISYDNAVIPLALLRMSNLFQKEEWQQIGLEAANFLDSILFQGDHLSTIGNDGWYVKGKECPIYGQQPIEVPSAIMLYQELYRLAPSDLLAHKIYKSFLWYLGYNVQGEIMFNASEGSCYDGLEAYGVNRNQGAESNISFWMSFVLLQEWMLERE